MFARLLTPVVTLATACQIPATHRDFITAFEHPPDGWAAGFRSLADWMGERGFSETSQRTEKTGRGWFSVGGANPYRGIRAPIGADYAVCESQFNADHTQLHGFDAWRRAKASEKVESMESSYDLTVAFQDDETARTRGVLISFFQIFEETREHDWRPAYSFFFRDEKLHVGARDDNPPIPGVSRIHDRRRCRRSQPPRELWPGSL